MNEALLVVDDPLREIRAWYDDAVKAGIPQAEAMTLATATPDGRPSLRVVLYKAGGDALRFFTNYESRKGQEMAANSRVAANFFWETLGRQIRIEGQVVRLPAEENDAYFASRPRESQMGAWASAQSREIASREELEDNLARVHARFAQGPVPRPPHWGGYRLDPDAIEFWSARPFRLHDRLLYTRAGSIGGWQVRRLSP